MFARPRIPGLVLALTLIALTLPHLASIFFLNLANTQIARAVTRPTDAPDRAALLADADVNLARVKTYGIPARLSFSRARLALAQDDLPRALSAFDAADSSTQSDFIAQFVWGDVVWRAGQRDAAFAHWRAAGAREFFRQQMNRAQYAHRWQDVEYAARKTIGIDPDFAEGYYVLGNALSQRAGNEREALAALERARALTQDKEFLSTILSRQGEILASQNQLDTALAAFTQARQFAPLDARPRTDYAVVYSRANPTVRNDSVALLNQVVGDSPWYSAAYIALAEMVDADGEALLKKGLEKNPNDASLWFALGQWYARHQRFAGARVALLEARKNETRADLLEQIARSLADLPNP